MNIVNLHFDLGTIFKFESGLLIMPAKYSEDLRWRAVWLHIVRGMSIKEILSGGIFPCIIVLEML